jgi:uncharacterized membrane protein YgdD (TMEM256/DUF423 family)
MERVFLILGGISGFLAVAAGAFGGHALKERLAPEMLAIFEVGARYHMYHTLALLGTAWACTRWPGPWTSAAGWCFAGGILVFSGSLYLLSLTGTRWLGAITPLGGLSFMAGWLCLTAAAWKG